jgi:hypothetical protein
MTPLADQCKTLALPTPYRVLGQVLEPLCIGHMALFDRLDVKDCATRDKLMLLVLICSHKPSELPKAMSRWTSKVRWAVWGWRCHKLLRTDAAFILRQALMAEYLELHTKIPDSYIASSHEEAETKIPFHQWLRVSLMANLNYNPATVDDMPYRQAVMDLMTYQEQQGAIEILDGYRGEMADEMFDMANRFHEQRMKGGDN